MVALHNSDSGISYETQKQVLNTSMAVLVDHISQLPREDKEDLYLLFRELSVASTAEEAAAVARAMTEILDQEAVTVERMPQPKDSLPDASLDNWLSYVSGRIRHFRKLSGLNQTELADKSGLPQSHISKLENGKHSPTRMTLEKIAAALDIDVSEFDPNESREG